MKKKLNLRGQAGKNIPAEERFWLQVRKTRGCWYWEGNKDIGGYGRIVVSGTKLKAHRYSWEIHNGEIPNGIFVCHKCDNPSCVKPDHLFLGSNNDNRQDSVSKNRHNCGYSVGESCALAKLTAKQVEEIRRRHQPRSRGKNGTSSLSREFGVLPEAIRRIIRGDSWTQLSGIKIHKGKAKPKTNRDIRQKLCEICGKKFTTVKSCQKYCFECR